MQLVKVTTSRGAAGDATDDEFHAAPLLFKTRAMAAAVADVAGHGATDSAGLADAEDTALSGAESEATEKGWF